MSVLVVLVSQPRVHVTLTCLVHMVVKHLTCVNKFLLINLFINSESEAVGGQQSVSKTPLITAAEQPKQVAINPGT